MEDISVFGLSLNVTFTNTFPNGITVTEFADDADPFDSPDLEIANMAMGPNGDTVTWSRPELIEIVVNVIPGSQADLNLTAALDANRVAKGKSSARDQVTIIGTYPDGSVVTASEGKMVVGPAVQSGASSGRAKTKRFSFRFAQVTRKNATAA